MLSSIVARQPLLLPAAGRFVDTVQVSGTEQGNVPRCGAKSVSCLLVLV